MSALQFFPHSMDDLKQSFLLTMELEDTRIKALQEIKARDEEISQLKELLGRAIKERDEAQEQCQKLILQNFLSNSNSGVSSIDDEQKKENEIYNGLSSSDCDESIVSSPRRISPIPELEFPVQPNVALPEKGKLLEAVIKAGPLLQTLLLAGPLPQWRHPPPPLDTNQIPPFQTAIRGELFADGMNGCGGMNRKRGGSSDGQDSSGKCRRILIRDLGTGGGLVDV